MSNIEHYLKQLHTKLQELKTILESGLPVSGTDLTDIKTNTGIVSACVDQINHHVKVDTNAINGVMTSVNYGNVDDGVQRVCIADDDNLTSQVVTYTSHLAQTIYDADFTSQNTNTVYLGQQLVTLGSGTIQGGTQRVCIANDDTNLSALKNTVNGSSQICQNLQAIADTSISHGDGNTDNGCQRVTIARDDYNVKQLIANSSGYIPAFNVALRGIHFGSGEEDIAVYQGNATTGTQRVCIATDDVNLASINAILTDVWDSTAHALRTV